MQLNLPKLVKLVAITCCLSVQASCIKTQHDYSNSWTRNSNTTLHNSNTGAINQEYIVTNIDNRGYTEITINIDSKNVSQLLKLGDELFAKENYKSSLTVYIKSLEVSSINKEYKQIALSKLKAGNSYQKMGNYSKAFTLYNEAKLICTKHHFNDISTNVDTCIGEIYNEWGQHATALQHFKEAENISITTNHPELTVIAYYKLGETYQRTKEYQKAYSMFEQGFAYNTKLGNTHEVLSCLNGIGETLLSQNKSELALEHFKKAKELSTKTDEVDILCRSIINIGNYYDHIGDHNNAILAYEEAAAIQIKNKKLVSASMSLFKIGTTYRNLGVDCKLKALYYLDKSVSIRLNNNIHDNFSIRCLLEVGHVFLDDYRNTSKATFYFLKAIDIIEMIRNTTDGVIRREYTQLQFDTYRLLALASVIDKDPLNTFYSMEIGRAKILGDTVSENENNTFEIMDLKSTQETLSDSDCLISYICIDINNIAVVAITNKRVTMKRLNARHFMSKLMWEYGFKKTTKITDISNNKMPDQDFLSRSVELYRSILTGGESNESRGLRLQNKLGKVAPERVCQIFFNFLLEPIEEIFERKSKLTIIPDGVLNFVPFETLINSKGNYLVSQFDVKYIQSASLLNMLNKRNYPQSKSIMAIGGAIYNKKTYLNDISVSKNLLHKIKNSFQLSSNKRSLRSLYDSLGDMRWENLPGTLDEVIGISNFSSDAKVLVGKDASEEQIKKMSNNGNLAEFRIIHFAAHGFVVPQLSELSALVFSDVNMPSSAEDGYLLLEEIQKLKLRASLVNLSACQTALGKIQLNEGVVGFNSAFIMAGANATSSSLWQVDDISTAFFMKVFYSLIFKNKMDYFRAMSETKRRFLKGEYGKAWKSPYYWASFVYYGK